MNFLPNFLPYEPESLIKIREDLRTILEKKSIKISIVIPAYGEEKTIAHLIDTIKDFPFSDEIIIINDGSKDRTGEIVDLLAQKYKKIVPIHHQVNKGKTAAVITGVSKATGDLIVLLDADLLTLTFDHLYRLMYYVVNGDYAMTILDRGSDRKSPIGWFHSFGGRIFGGERAFWKKDFEEIALNGDERYGLEAVMNLYYLQERLKIRTIYSPDLASLTQFDKKGVWGGLKTYQKMFAEMFESSDGPVGYLKQGVTIEEDRLEKLYKLKEKSRMRNLASVGIVVAGMALSVGSFILLNIRNRQKQSN